MRLHARIHSPTTLSSLAVALLLACGGTGDDPADASGPDGGLDARHDSSLPDQAPSDLIDGTDGGQLQGISVTVDETMELPETELPPREGDDQPRPLAAVADNGGRLSVFVDNEVMLTTDDQQALDTFLASHGGTLLETFGQEDQAPATHLVRVEVEPAPSDASRLSDDIEAVAPGVDAALTFSSRRALALFALVASATNEGLEIDVNYVEDATTFNDYTTGEAPDGSGGSTDAFSMWQLEEGGNVDTGVTTAWIALERAGKLENRIEVAIIDGGFALNDDFPLSLSAISMVGGDQPTDTNPNQCSGGNSCPWHGASVASAMMAYPDNEFGSAGPAGPVARGHFYHTTLDHSTIRSIVRNTPARIVNMSFSGDYSTTWQAFTISGYRDTLEDVGKRKLLFASAGNDGNDIGGDGQVTAPCEFSYVVCVGALAEDSTSAASFSNWDGGLFLDIWAPGTNLVVGPDPSTATNTTQTVSGTSVASPFAAGVAALIWAADPAMTRDEVESRLLASAHTGSPDAKVESWVDAATAVLDTLPDNPPHVAITSPMPDDVFVEYADITMEATVDDLDDDAGDYTITWIVDKDGVPFTLGSTDSGDTLVRPLPVCEGRHTLVAEARDTIGGGYATAEVEIVLEDDPDDLLPAGCDPAPDGIEIVQPTNGAVFAVGTAVTMQAQVSHDPPTNTIEWRRDDSDGLMLGTGLTTGAKFGEGSHTIWAGYGEASDTVTIQVEDTANAPPVATIDSPDDGETLTDYTTPPNVVAELTGHADDTEDGALTGSSLVWSYRRAGDSDWIEIGDTGETAQVSLMDDTCFGSSPYEIRLVATDSEGATDVVIISVAVNAILC